MSFSGETEEEKIASKMSLSLETTEEKTASKMSVTDEGKAACKMNLSGGTDEEKAASNMSLAYKTVHKKRLSWHTGEENTAPKKSLFWETDEENTTSKMSVSGQTDERKAASKMGLCRETDEEKMASEMALSCKTDEDKTVCKKSLSWGADEENTASKMTLSWKTDEEKVLCAVSPSQMTDEEKAAFKLSHPVETGDNKTASKMSLSEKDDIHYKDKSPIQQKRSVSPGPSCASVISEGSMDHPKNFKERDFPTELRVKPVRSQPTENNNLENVVIKPLKNECTELQAADYPKCLKEDEEELVPVSQHKFKNKMEQKFKTIFEGIAKQGNPTLLNEIYTELYITEGGSGEVNNEHEVRQIETASRRPQTEETPIQCNVIFKPLPGQDKPIRTVLTRGVAGIGKTVSVQKFILDWAEGKTNQDIKFIFPLPLQELNVMTEKKLSLMDLLQHLFPETKELRVTESEKYKVMFIFDGLDECRLPLDFHNNEVMCDVTKPISLDALLTNIIKGNLLPSALLWITSRPAAANKIPPECVDQVTEVRGFNETQKEEYFRKRISDQNLANRIISHIKSSRSLYIMCHIPVFCWISATVLERMLSETESGEIPKTLTQMYSHFLIFQIKQRNQKYIGHYVTDACRSKQSILSLAKLAFKQLEKGNLTFYEEDLRQCGIDVREAAVYSGVCTQIFREEFGLYHRKVYSFVHLSIQEFLAALFVMLCFSDRDDTEQQKYTELLSVFNMEAMSDLLKSAVDKALESENGHLDLFLRFLLGLSLESNQTLLQGLLNQTGISSQSKEETVKYIKEKIRENPSPEKSINLFHCLNKLKVFLWSKHSKKQNCVTAL